MHSISFPSIGVSLMFSSEIKGEVHFTLDNTVKHHKKVEINQLLFAEHVLPVALLYKNKAA